MMCVAQSVDAIIDAEIKVLADIIDYDQLVKYVKYACFSLYTVFS